MLSLFPISEGPALSVDIKACVSAEWTVKFVPTARIESFASSLFCSLPRILNAFLDRHPSYDIFNDSTATLFRLFSVILSLGHILNILYLILDFILDYSY